MDKTIHKKTVAIIGAGFAGLTTAAILAKSGFKVKVFEKNYQAGGRAIQKKINGYTFDLGPSWYMMPAEFENLFNILGEDINDWIKLTTLSPTYRAFFDDQNIDIFADRNKLKTIINQLEPGTEKKIDLILDRAKYLYEISVNKFLRREFNSIFDFWDPIFVIRFLRMRLFESYERYINKNFKSPKIRNLLTWHSIFVGGAPSDVPALYSLMLHADIDLGTYYPDGGFYKIAESLQKIAQKYGAEFFFDSPVQKIEIKDKKAIGIIVNNKLIATDLVISNADYHHTEMNLIDEESRSYDQKFWDEQTMSPSTYLLFLGVDKKISNLLHHNYYFSPDTKKHLHTISNKTGWPSQPSFYISCPSKTDKNVAPEGKENLMLLVPIASGIIDSQVEREKMRTYLVNKLSELINEDIEAHIEVEFHMAHNDFTNLYNAYKGNAFGLANLLFQTGSFRPKLHSKKVKDLFFTGTTTIPGISVPLALISGQLTSKKILTLYDS